MAPESESPTVHHLPTPREPSTLAQVPRGEPSVNREELRQVEARFDARFQAVSARFTVTDRNMATVRERLEALELHSRDLTEHVDKQGRTVDARFDAIDARIDQMQDSDDAERANRRRDRLPLYALVGLVVVDVHAVIVAAVWLW